MANEHHPEKGFDPLKMILGIIFFIIAYAVLFFVGSANSQIGTAVANIPVLNLVLPIPPVIDPPGNLFPQVSMMHLLLPAIGFLIIFFGTDWIGRFFETKHSKTIVFPIIFIIFCLGAFFVSLYWMATETAVLNGVPISQIVPDFWSYFWSELRVSAFYLFLLGGLLGWISKIVLEKIKL
ncbi:MAG: hypothetical protein PHD95_02040 [Candidatus ainarchaeum sp.]|nr:hypothetical protein [Candidatus ainarchaeum sp.]